MSDEMKLLHSQTVSRIRESSFRGEGMEMEELLGCIVGWFQACSASSREVLNVPQRMVFGSRSSFLLLVALLSVVRVDWSTLGAWAAAPPLDFLYIDCGSSAPYTDPVTGIKWVPDDGYITSGFNYVNVSNAATELQTFRYFNNSYPKDCYRLPVTSNGTYILRASFYIGESESLLNTSSFQMAIGATVLANITTSIGLNDDIEFTYSTQSNVTFLCLLRDFTNSNPFISAISLRLLQADPKTASLILENPVHYLRTLYRLDWGGAGIKRFPYDKFDRYWHGENESSPYVAGSLHSLSTTHNVSGSNWHNVPSIVLQSALGAKGNMTISLNVTHNVNFALLYLYFAELDPKANATNREMWITLENYLFPDAMLENIYASAGGLYKIDCWEYQDFSINTSSLNIVLSTNSGTILQPMMNALELYEITLSSTTLQTNIQDALAIEGIKANMSLGEWTGDPCIPVPHAWLTCGFGPTLEPHVITVNLSGYPLNESSISPSFANLVSLTSLDLHSCGLIGTLPDLSSMKNLQTLNLDDNLLTGPLPEWLTSFTELTRLFVENNNFTGPIPSKLLSTQNLNFRYAGNPLLGNLTSIPATSAAPNSRFNSNIGIIVGTVVGGFLVFAAIVFLVVYFVCCRHRSFKEDLNLSKSEVKTISAIGGKAYTLPELVIATENFKKEIGKGGYGSVYYGKLSDGQELAVKMLNIDSHQGSKEFSNEVQILSRVHHKNLVELLGYCIENDNQILVYEYIHEGSLYERLHGNSHTLDWKTRLNIAINAAQGLDYLHTGCNPSMIHRDVKSSNILLTQKLESAKVSDFGLSRLAPIEDGTHVSTIVKGTTGYVDPEYCSTQHLSTKSDVFSFGVVLLELITSRPVNVTRDNTVTNICEWVRVSLELGDIEKMMDSTVNASHRSRESVWKIANVAMQCVEPKGANRPAMSEVADEIRKAMALEGVSPPHSHLVANINTHYETNNDLKMSPGTMSFQHISPR